MSERRTWPVGTHIMDEMQDRDWSMEDLAQALRMPVNEAEDLIAGRKRVFARHAEGLSHAFEIHAHVWLTLQKESDTKGERRTWPVGAHIADEMDERDWSLEDLAQALGIPAGEAEDIVTGRKRVLARHAEGLSHAFGTSAHVWLNLQKANDRA